jgi:hypothetical protein
LDVGDIGLLTARLLVTAARIGRGRTLDRVDRAVLQGAIEATRDAAAYRRATQGTTPLTEVPGSGTVLLAAALQRSSALPEGDAASALEAAADRLVRFAQAPSRGEARWITTAFEGVCERAQAALGQSDEIVHR